MTSQSEGMNNDEMMRNMELIKAQMIDLEAAKLELKAEKMEWQRIKGGSRSTKSKYLDRELKAQRLQLEAEKMEWQRIRDGGGSAKSSYSDSELKAERFQLEAEKTQIRVAQALLKAEQSQLESAKSQLKAAQSQLEAAKSQLETAQTQLEKTREQLEYAREQLKDAKAQTDIDNIKLEAAKESLEIAKYWSEAASKQLIAAKSQFGAAKGRLDMATLRIEAEKAHLADEKAALGIKVSKAESENAKLVTKVSKMENEKFEQGEKMREIAKKLDQCCKDKKALQGTNGSQNRRVFLDLSYNGVAIGRIVIELDYHTTPITAENFRALCTAQKGTGPSGKTLHYRRSIFYYTNRLVKFCTSECLDGPGCVPSFPKENLTKKHFGPGIVSMVSEGDSHFSNGYEFFITTETIAEYDGRNVVFGRVVEGMDVVMATKNISIDAKTVISECGQLS